VWRSGPALRSLRHTVERPQEHLLADLGRATRLWPRLETSLQAARPTRAELDGAGAQQFLGESAPLLEQAGFGVLVPPWWRSARGRLGLRLRAKPRRTEDFEASPFGLGLAGVCDYRYEVAVGDATLTAKELRALAKLKTPLVRVRGQWVELRPGDVERALAVLRRPAPAASGDPTVTAGQVLRIGLGLEPAPGVDLPVVSVAADGWLGDLLSGDGDRRLVGRATPAGFDGSLRPYQERGLAWLSFLGSLGLGACLADDMGLGKTAQLLALLLAEREGEGRRRGGGNRPRGRRPAPTLLVCPMSLVGNWQREAARFTPGLAVHVHHGAAREVGPAFTRATRRADLVITTYALLARDRKLLAKVAWGRLALDEAQNVKNPSSQAARAARSLPAGTRVALTGTPVENRLRELWALMDFLNPGLLGTEGTFRARFAIPVERYHDEAAAGTLKRLTGPFVLRRLKTDRSIIADLPDKVEMNVLCNLTREQASLYQAVVDEMLAKIEQAATGIERMGIISGSMMKLKQVCNHPAHFLGDGSRLGGARSGKLARLEETLEEITASGERALCFTQFAQMGSLLCGHLEARLGSGVPFLHGGVAKRARDQMVAEFQSDGGPPLLLLSLKAGGVGLNLTAANHVIHFDRWWNPAVEDQATDRAFRIGQRRDVQVRKFVCVGTVEERIDQMIEAKRELAQRIVGSGEAWVNELSVAQLRDLVALSDDAVAEA
ncbi:MAG: DEAD/DEAH box helicase, partial [Acidimicrobiia bacterium]